MISAWHLQAAVRESSHGIVQGTYETFVEVGRYKVSETLRPGHLGATWRVPVPHPPGRVTAAPIAYGGMAATSKRAPATERSVAGRRMRVARSLFLKALAEVAGRSTSSDTRITGMRERDRAGRTAATGGTHAPTLASETPR